MAEQTEIQKDLAAFDPKPVGTLTIYERDAKGLILKDGAGAPKIHAEVPILGSLDFPFPIATRLRRLEEESQGKEMEEQYTMIKTALQTVCPTLTDELVELVTPSDAIRAWLVSTGQLVERPPVAGTETGGDPATSGISSPLPASPSAGPTTTPGG